MAAHQAEQPPLGVGLRARASNGQATGAHQWLVNVTLLRE